MSDTNQAQADLAQDDQTVSDPLDAENSTDSGAAELDEYEKEVYGLVDTPIGEEEHGETPADPDNKGKIDDDPSWSDEESSASESPTGEAEDDSEPSGQDDPDNEEEGDDPQKPKQYRFRPQDEVEAEAFSLRKRHPDWSLEKCLASAKNLLGVTNETQEGEPSQQQQQANQETETSEKVAQQIKDLQQKKREASDALDFDEVANLDEKITDLLEKKVELRILERQAAEQKESQKASEAQRAFDAEWDESTRKALTFYPDSGNADTPLGKKMIELDTQMRELGDPLFNSPDKPFTLAKRAALALGIPMQKPAAQDAPKKKDSKSPSPVQPASGNSRTSSAKQTTSKQQLEASLAQVDSIDAYEELVGGLIV